MKKREPVTVVVGERGVRQTFPHHGKPARANEEARRAAALWNNNARHMGEVRVVDLSVK